MREWKHPDPIYREHFSMLEASIRKSIWGMWLCGIFLFLYAIEIFTIGMKSPIFWIMSGFSYGVFAINIIEFLTRAKDND